MYVAIAYAITWTVVGGLYGLYRRDVITRDELNVWFNVGALGPPAAAIITTRLMYGAQGLKRLWSLLSPRRMEWKSTLLAVTPVLLFAIGLLTYPLFGHRWFGFDITRQQFGLTNAASYWAWVTPNVSYALLEELGWRGFLLPHLQRTHSALKSTMMLTVIWGLWHAPMFLFRFNFSVGISVGFFFGLFVGAIVLTSIFNFSRGSVLAASLFHLTNNLASAFDKDYIVAVLSTGFVLLAIFLLWKFKSDNLADRSRVVSVELPSTSAAFS